MAEVQMLSPSKLLAMADGEYKYWDVGDVEPFCNLGKSSVYRVFYALLRCGGSMLDSCLHGSLDAQPRYISVVYRIKIPVGAERLFENLSGYKLTEPPRVSGV